MRQMNPTVLLGMALWLAVCLGGGDVLGADLYIYPNKRYGNDLPENGPGCGSSDFSWGLRIDGRLANRTLAENCSCRSPSGLGQKTL